MNWFLVYFFVMGLLLGIVPGFIKKNIKKAVVETNKFERNDALEKMGTWLLIYAWVIVFIAIGFTTRVAMDTNKECKKIDSRIEAIEKQMPTPAVDTLYIYRDMANNE